ncbi:MAG: hypothetical protein ABR907_11345 [Terracidiphilus sp.]|jgi:hypothetical protein
MSTSTIEPKTLRRSRFKSILKLLLFAGLVVGAVITIANWIWTMSGSNRWELIRDENGIKIYALKTPGEAAEKFKGVVNVRSSLTGLVMLMYDPTMCTEIGCYDPKGIGGDLQVGYTTFMINPPYPFPFQPRQFVARVFIYQDKSSKEVLIQMNPALDRLPPDDRYFRVSDFYNRWRFTPQKDGVVEAEYILDDKFSGFVPNFLERWRRPKFVYRVLASLPGHVAKYQQAKLPFIENQ